MDALLVIDKPAGLTSHDVVTRVRRLAGERSVGHLGTLDPMATGVLPLVLGRYTRLAQFFHDSSKVYEGEIRFGFATDTYDAEGEPVGAVQDASPSLGDVQHHLGKLTGRILQQPPAYSAKKINGVAAYKLARKDKPVELRAVEVEVRRFEVQGIVGCRARFVAEVSAGTYIRSLAHDLGQMLGCGAHLSQLRRIRSGELTIEQSHTLESFENYCKRCASHLDAMSDNAYSVQLCQDPVNIAAPWLHPREILRQFPSVTASTEVVAAIRNGRPVNLPEFSTAPLVKVFANQRLLLAVMQRVAGTLFHPKVVLYGSNEPLPE